jgi:hypothetical protein
VRPASATRGGIAAVAALSGLLAAAGGAGASEYSQSIAKKVENEVVYVDRKARPKVSIGEAGQLRLRILDKAAGRIKIAVLPESRVEDEGGVSGLGSAIARDLKPKGALLVVAGDSRFIITSHPASDQAATAVDEAFNRRPNDSRGRELLGAVNGIAAADPGPSADPPDMGGGGVPGNVGNFEDQTDDIFDTVDDAIKTTTIIIAAFFIIPILALLIWIALRVRRSRKEAAGDLDFEQEGLRNELIALGDDIRALEVDTTMPGVNAMGVADYEAAVHQYDRANFALERSDQNPRYVAEARAAIAEGKRRMSDAKVRLGVTPTP